MYVFIVLYYFASLLTSERKMTGRSFDVSRLRDAEIAVVEKFLAAMNVDTERLEAMTLM